MALAIVVGLRGPSLAAEECAPVGLTRERPPLIWLTFPRQSVELDANVSGFTVNSQHPTERQYLAHEQEDFAVRRQDL